MSLLTGARRLGRALPIDHRIVHGLRQGAGLGFQAAALWRHGFRRKPGGPGPGPIVVAGFHGSVLGIGEGARAFSAALRQAGPEVIDWDISALFGHDRHLKGDHEAAPPTRSGAMVIHLNPRELIQLVAMTGAAPFEGRFCVGYWAWELERVPRAWAGAFRYVDEVWTPSAFVAGAVALAAPPALPVRVLAHPLAPSPATPDRARFGLPEHPVMVLAAFDMRSGYARKNPVGAVRAFRQARRAARTPALLVVKVTGASGAPDLYAALLDEIGADPAIRVIDDWLSPADMAALIASADILLSLHRSEGFGLSLAQAMLAGKAVVATGWSGNLDFMNEHTAALVNFTMVPVVDSQGLYPRGRWAEPDIDDAAAKLAALIDDAPARQAMGERAAKATATALDPARLGAQALAWLGQPAMATVP